MSSIVNIWGPYVLKIDNYRNEFQKNHNQKLIPKKNIIIIIQNAYFVLEFSIKWFIQFVNPLFEVSYSSYSYVKKYAILLVCQKFAVAKLWFIFILTNYIPDHYTGYIIDFFLLVIRLERVSIDCCLEQCRKLLILIVWGLCMGKKLLTTQRRRLTTGSVEVVLLRMYTASRENNLPLIFGSVL